MLKFLILNFIISLTAYYYFYKKKRSYAFISLIIITFLPIGGLMLFIALDLSRSHMKESRKIFMLSEEEESSDFVNLILTRANLKSEINIIPIEDALVLNDNKIKRTLITDALKGDVYSYLEILKEALKDSDTETSHYAATAVSEIKRKLELSINELEREYYRDHENIEVMKSFGEILRKYIESGLLNNRSCNKYMITYSETLNKILQLEKTKEYYFEEKIRCDIELKKYQDAIEGCTEYINNFKKSDKPYILLLKVYYIERNKKAFDEVIQRLRKSDVRLSRESLRIIRFWLEGA